MFSRLPTRTRSIVKLLVLCFSVSTIIAIIKIIYGLSTDSLAFLADGIHSLLDSGATIFGIISVILATKPPDEAHPYGHKKFEILSAMFLGILILIAAVEVGEAAYSRLTNTNKMPTYSHWGFLILFFTMLANISIALIESRAAKRLGSPFLASDSIHNRSDFVITCGVFISLVSVRLGNAYLDSIVSLGIALYLAYLSFRVIVLNLNPLMDHRVLDPVKVEQIVSSIDGVISCHKIRSRGEKGHYFLDLHIHLPEQTTLARAHEITHEVENKLKENLPGLADVVIHTEPDEKTFDS